MKDNSKSARDAEVTIKWKTIALRYTRSWRNNPMKHNPKSAQEAELSNNQMKHNLKVREMVK